MDSEGGECPFRAVQAGGWPKPDRLAGREIHPPNPSQTFSSQTASAALPEHSKWPLCCQNGANGPFSLVKRPIKHNGRYELSNCYLLLVSNGFGGDKIEDTLSEKRFLYGEVSELQFFKRA